jgi:predicted transcriptional regulator
MLGKSLSHFDRNIILSLQKESKTVRQLREEFSIDPATIRRTLRRLIRHGFAAKVWHGKDTKTNRETPYYSSDLETVRFCQLRKEASNDRLY